MSGKEEVIFLGINDAGRRVYDWLCSRDDVFVYSLITTEEQLSIVEDVKPDFIVSCGYRHIVPERILEIPENGCINIHPAYLPYNRGANPNVWSIVEGTPAGATVHYMDAGIDSGDIITRRKVESDFADTGKDLYNRLEDAQVELFRETWPEIVSGDVSVTTQEEGAGTYHRNSDFAELCELDPEAEVVVKEFLDRLRALTFPPYKNAELEIDGTTYYVEVNITEE